MAKKVLSYQTMTLAELNRLAKILGKESCDNPELLKIQTEIEMRVDAKIKEKD